MRRCYSMPLLLLWFGMEDEHVQIQLVINSWKRIIMCYYGYMYIHSHVYRKKTEIYMDVHIPI